MTPAAIEKLKRKSAEIETDLPFYPRKAAYIVASRGKYRIPVAISRARAVGFYASARFDRKSHSAWGKTPADAFVKTLNQLDHTYNRMIVREEMEVK